MENERYLESKMVTNGFGSYLELSAKGLECIVNPNNTCIKIFETNEMKAASEVSSKPSVSSSGVRILNQTHNQYAFFFYLFTPLEFYLNYS